MMYHQAATRTWYAVYVPLEASWSGLCLQALYVDQHEARHQQGLVSPADVLSGEEEQIEVWPHIEQAWFTRLLLEEGWRTVDHPNQRLQIYAPDLDDMEEAPLHIFLAAHNQYVDAWTLLMRAMRLFAMLHDLDRPEQVAMSCLARAAQSGEQQV